MPTVATQTIELDGQPVLMRVAEEIDGGPPILYLHDALSSSFQWLGPLELGGGVAPDLPGYGRSGKRADLDFTIPGYVRFLDRLLDALEIDRVRLCVHGWGAVGLAWAAANPQRVTRAVVVAAVPLLPGYEWHKAARLWRMPLVGDVVIGSMTLAPFKLLERITAGPAGRLPADLIEHMRGDFDLGTQRALVKLHRAASPGVLAYWGAGLAAIDAPALVLWGSGDPWVPARFGPQYAVALGNGTFEEVPGAGHWPWIDQPAVAERIVGFLTAGA